MMYFYVLLNAASFALVYEIQNLTCVTQAVYLSFAPLLFPGTNKTSDIHF